MNDAGELARQIQRTVSTFEARQHRAKEREDARQNRIAQGVTRVCKGCGGGVTTMTPTGRPRIWCDECRAPGGVKDQRHWDYQRAYYHKCKAEGR